MTKRNIIVGVGIVALAIGWYTFRPELLFVNKTVNEEFPARAAMASIEKGSMTITKGNFKGLAHCGTLIYCPLPQAGEGVSGH